MGKLLSRGRRCPEQFLVQLFDQQLQTLQRRSCPGELVDELKASRDRVIEAARQKNLKPGIGFSPFLPVLPFSVLRANLQMGMVWGAIRDGIAPLNLSRLTDEEQLPERPYYIFGVEDGRNLLDRATDEAEAEIKALDRKPLTTAEGIALAIQTGVLKSHGINLLGSRYAELDEETGWVIRGTGSIPLLCNSDRPELTYDVPRRFGFEKRGVPSKLPEVISLE